jgi:hypothetical protein
MEQITKYIDIICDEDGIIDMVRYDMENENV